MLFCVVGIFHTNFVVVMCLEVGDYNLDVYTSIVGQQ